MVIKRLKLAHASETLKSLLISQSSQTRSRNRRIFHVFFLQMCFCIGLVHIEVAFGNQTHLRSVQPVAFFFCLKWILGSPDHLRDPDLLLTWPKARSGQIRLLPVRNVTGDERAHARNKSSIFDVLNNEFDRAVKFFSNKTWLYAHLKYEPTNFLLFLFFLTSNSTRQLV